MMPSNYTHTTTYHIKLMDIGLFYFNHCYTYTHTYIFICKNTVYMCVNKHIYVYVNKHTCTCIHIDVCLHINIPFKKETSHFKEKENITKNTTDQSPENK